MHRTKQPAVHEVPIFWGSAVSAEESLGLIGYVVHHVRDSSLAGARSE